MLKRSLTAIGLGALVIVGAFGPLLAGRAAASRDIPSFHLPLRTALADLAVRTGGLPTWNPWLHGGQPLLSNPNYAAFYPPTWVALTFDPVYGISFLLLFHASLAFAGGWVLARRLGCGTAAAAFAATGFAGGGAFLSLTASLNLLCSLAWLPWVLVATIRVLSAPRDEGLRGWLPAAAGGGAALAATLLAGDPSGSLLAGFGILAISVSALARRGRVSRGRRLGRLSALALLTVALSAVQWWPTWQRLEGSSRAETLPLEEATLWSTPPLRLAELVFPRLWGDPSRINEGRFFGWSLHDRGYPYVVSIYPGLLVVLLGVATLVRGPLPLRSAWITALSLGVFLALGRHNPLYPWLHEHVPLLGRTRYPEKLLLLVTSVLPFVAALGWQRLLTERRRGRVVGVDLPLALGVSVVAIFLALTWGIRSGSPRVDDFLRAGSPLPPSEGALAAGRAYLEMEAWVAAGFALAAVSVLAAVRWRKVPIAVVGFLAVAVLAGDLWYYGHGLVQTVPAEMFRRPPTLAQQIPPGDPSERRIFRLPDPRGDLPEFLFQPEEPFSYHVRHGLEKIDPLSGLLWGLGHTFPPDYDLMLTARARRNQSILHQSWASTDLGMRVLGAWSVGHLITPRTLEERLEAFLDHRDLPPAEMTTHPYLLPPFRFVPEVVMHRAESDALQAAAERGFDVFRTEHWVGSGEPGPRPRTQEKPELLAVEERGGEIEIHYRAPADSYLVAAVTWDRGWSAHLVDELAEATPGRWLGAVLEDLSRGSLRRFPGDPLPLYVTALGQIGCAVPAGEHRLLLTYRDPSVTAGAAVTGGTVLLLLLVGTVSGLRARGRRKLAADLEQSG